MIYHRRQSGLWWRDSDGEFAPPSACHLHNGAAAAAGVARMRYKGSRTNLVAVWDPNDPLSWPGSGSTLKNAWKSPADGSAQAAYNLTKSAGTSIAGTFPAKYAQVDGSGANLVIGANTTFTKSFNKTTAAYTWLGFVYINSFADDGVTFYCTRSGGVGEAGALNWSVNSTGNKLTTNTNNNTGDVTQDSGIATSSGAWHMIAFAIDGDNGANCVIFHDNTSAALPGAPATGAVDPAQLLTFGGISRQLMTVNSRFGLMALYNVTMTLTQIQAIWNLHKADYGL